MICLGFTAVIGLLYVKGWLYGHAERSSRDWLLTNSAARRSPADPRIILLAIDENTRMLDDLFAEDLEKSATLRLMKQGFPWANRQVWADIVDRLCDAGASAVLFDVAFPAEKEGDEAFRAALLRHPGKVALGTILARKQQTDEGASVKTDLPTYIIPAPLLRPPSGVPSWLGFVSLHADGDDLVRRVYFRTTLFEFFGLPSPPGAEEVHSLAARGLENAGLSDHIPPGRKAVMFRAAEEFTPRSLHEIFVDAQWNAPPYNKGQLFRDKIVVIGATEQTSEDRVQTPFGAKIGVDIHLDAINAALNGDFVTETSTPVDLGLIAGGGLLAWFLGAWIRKPIVRLLALAATAFMYYEVAQNLASNYDVLVTLLSPLLALATSGITWSAWEQILDRVERQRMRRTFERYVSKDVVRELLDNPQSYLNSLGGLRKEITVLFSDVRSFTTLTESADPHALVSQLNEYFEAMVAIVFANQGTLDKFIGDAVMAHWGSIVTEGASVDATRAVTTVLQMREALAMLNADWRQRGMPEMHVGFGVNHGEAIVGNLGCEAKMEVSVIGDAVNLGSRLEGATKQFHIDLCIGEKAAALVRDHFRLRSVDLLVVKGKTQPAEIFTVLGKLDAPEPAWLSRHEEAMKLYRTGDFAAAEKAWRQVLAEEPGDGLAETFIGRCVALQIHPPAPPWTGVYEMKSK
jgi:adenylate cyclase